jgi:TonB family protein
LNADRAPQLKASVMRLLHFKSRKYKMKYFMRVSVTAFLIAVCNVFIVAQSNTVDGIKNPDLRTDKIYEMKEVDTKTVILSKIEPEFTAEAKKKKISGAVMLALVLSASGQVEDIEVISGLPEGLTQKAIEAARQIRFTPAIKDSRAVSQRTLVEYNFNYHKKKFYGDRSSMTYFKQGCVYVPDIKSRDLALFKSEKEAKQAGFTKATKKCP